MKKSLFFIILSIFLITTLIYADANLDIQENSVSLQGNLTQTLANNFTIENIGTINITNIQFTVDSTLTSGSHTIADSNVIINSGASENLNIEEQKIIPFTVFIPETTYGGTYTGLLKASNETYSDTITLYVTVNSVSSIDAQSEIILSGEEYSTISESLNIKNTGSTDITISSGSFTFSQDDFTDNDHNITITFPTTSTIPPGTTQSFTIQAEIPNNMDLGIYKGSVNVTSGSAQDSFILEIRVTPEICEEGIIGNLEISIDEPDYNDEFYPGETMDIEVTVNNNDDNELDVIVEAFLYNINEDDEIKRVKSDSIEIDNGDSEDFNLNLKIPYNGDLDEDDTYLLYLKAYEEGNEDDHCMEDYVEVDIERKKHEVIVEELIFSPSTVQCGDAITAVIDIKNIGKSDEEDVRVSLKQTEIGIDKTSDFFDLEEYDDDDNEITQRFTFTIPEDAKEGDYDFETIVYFNNGGDSNSDFYKLNITCEEILEEEAEETQEAEEESITAGEEVTGAVTYMPTFSLKKLIGNNELITAFWIIGDIALLLIVIYFIKLLFFTRRY
jgi:hypothetical protein